MHPYLVLFLKEHKLQAMRNKIIHEYFGVSASTVYNTAIINLPELKLQLTNISIL